jgi:amidase
MVRSGQISSRELTKLALARIDAINPSLNAVVELRPEAALREAAAAYEITARGEAMGPLHGVPVTIKEALQITGMHSTWGNPGFRDFVADGDATVVRAAEAGWCHCGRDHQCGFHAE